MATADRDVVAGDTSVSRPKLQQALEEFSNATNMPEGDIESISKWISTADMTEYVDPSSICQPHSPVLVARMPLKEWQCALESELRNETVRDLAVSILSVAFLRERRWEMSVHRIVEASKYKEQGIQLFESLKAISTRLESVVSIVCSWERAMIKGQRFATHSSLEFAMREFEHATRSIDRARAECHEIGLRIPVRYIVDTEREVAKTHRRSGRYETALSILNNVLCAEEIEKDSIEYIRVQGELGVVLRGTPGCDEKAFRAFTEQYVMAKDQFVKTNEPEYKQEMCRAVGNLGTSNYECALLNKNAAALVNTAIGQLRERVQLAKELGHHLWESIGWARLSACYLELKNKKEATHTALEGICAAKRSEDPIALALSRFFYGRVLLQMYSRHEEALQQFNPCDERSTPAISLCKEPSALHARFLDELIKAGADLTLTDEDGYNALDWTVFNRQMEMQALVEDGLREAKKNVEELRMEAMRRRGYREVLQEKLRPELANKTAIADIRKAYDDALDGDEDKDSMFDRLKFVRYRDFEAAKQIPRSDHTTVTEARTIEPNTIDSVLFFSYRWLGDNSPDDKDNTQYQRMLNAAEKYMKHSYIDPERLAIWIDFACINQNDTTTGIAALPMILIQCDAVISLVDEAYFGRAWCSLEVKLVRQLKKCYDRPEWFVDRPLIYDLQKGPLDMKIGSVAEKPCGNPTDMPKLLFLERQSKLLGIKE